MDGLTNAAPGDAAAEIDKLISGGDDELIIPDLVDGQGGDDEIEIVDEPAPEPAKSAAPEPEPEAKPPTIDDAAEALKAQLAERDRQIAALRSSQENDKRASWRQQVEHTRVTLATAAAAFERDIAATEREYQEALGDGDYAKASKLTRELGKLAYRQEKIEEGLRDISAEEERIKSGGALPPVQPQTTQPQQPQRQLTQDEMIEQTIANSPPAKAQWLRKNRDVFTDQKRFALSQAAHFEAVANGLDPQANEADYWNYIDDRMNRGAKASEPKKAAPSPVTAPSSRSVASPVGGSSPRTVTLTPAEVDIAKAWGWTNKEYAKWREFDRNQRGLN